ncbi:hypothetical protein CF327_g945 [Tilletia walkeri]|uniref:Rhodanese domain-containing protein n=1 Tax=Tilletia walkeri TaxID=117179 RepID=A0A8X7T5G9_9BASI|nr:hypothetical protein CF327_g945 [Tilletia walkeri]KAE8269501.1 hypothetical protein A4X09_0g2854 [Tilletia walkeri]
MLSRTIVSAIPRTAVRSAVSVQVPAAASASASIFLRYASTTTSTAPRRRLAPPSLRTANAISVRGLHVSIPARSNNKDTSWVDQGEVTYAELKPETQAPSGNITIIDVREPDEVAQGIIPSAVNVPLSEFNSAFSASKVTDFSKKFGFERPEFDGQVVFYCRSGKRSQQALDFARSQGWWNSRNYTGSWLDWTAKEEKK